MNYCFSTTMKKKVHEMKNFIRKTLAMLHKNLSFSSLYQPSTLSVLLFEKWLWSKSIHWNILARIFIVKHLLFCNTIWLRSKIILGRPKSFIFCCGEDQSWINSKTSWPITKRKWKMKNVLAYIAKARLYAHILKVGFVVYQRCK